MRSPRLVFRKSPPGSGGLFAFRSSGFLKTRDVLVTLLLFLVTAAFVFWQNSRVAVLWDLSYLLDTSWRIALGRVPYRDFPLVHPPLTFLIQAGLMCVAGRHFWIPVSYSAVIGGLGTGLTWRILFGVLRERANAWRASLLLAAPLTFLGIYGIYPHPIYDCDCAFAILVALFLLQKIAVGQSRAGFVTGVVVVIPAFFKQNMGLPFLLAVLAAVLVVLGAQRIGQTGVGTVPAAILVRLLAAIGVGSLLGLTLIQVTAGLGNYVQWTVDFAARRRLPGFADMLAIYQQPSFVWTLPAMGGGILLLLAPIAGRLWVRMTAGCLLAAPFVASLIFLLRSDDADDRAENLLAIWPLLLLVAAVVALLELRKGIVLSRLIPFCVLAAIHGTFLSQQLWGSTYAIWPLLMILVAVMVAALPGPGRSLQIALAAVVCLTLTVCGGLYAASLERLNYVHSSTEGALVPATTTALRGMVDRGPYLADFEELVAFASREIPLGDGMLLLPGEEPFFFATGRTPQFPVQIFDRTTDPYSPDQLMEELRRRGIRWVIVKTRLQSTEDPLPERERTMGLLAREFGTGTHLAGYDVYRRR